MIAVLNGTGEHPEGRLIGRTTASADLLARIASDEDTHDWQPALRHLRDGDGELVVTTTDDRHYRWRLVAPDGAVLAESPPIYRDEQACRDAFATARRAADLV
ncbi:DUF1508 domain-containing protein [Actinoplanes sp. CA-142083]|uniref:DUF1508 domain-containing protein n=1 Tax=Actinoplanes sp. CA-142083 TaxID=3239903 RepID=UPI003D8EAEAE